MKLKKRKKTGKFRGRSSHGWGARKKHKGGSGYRGGFGMAGTGKMAGQKKMLLQKLYGDTYFGKQGVTSRGTRRRKEKIINVAEIELKIEKLKKEFGNKEGIIILEGYKILGDGEIKIKVHIQAKSASKSAVEKIKKAGGKIELAEEDAKEEETSKETKKE